MIDWQAPSLSRKNQLWLKLEAVLRGQYVLAEPGVLNQQTISGILPLFFFSSDSYCF